MDAMAGATGLFARWLRILGFGLDPFEVAVQDLVSKGVEFRVCEYTLTSRNIDKKQMIDEIKYVPSGGAEVGRLQAQEGYAYLKP
jgi:intracellular sulfur oxidation DsrE/DsrF family protein